MIDYALHIAIILAPGVFTWWGTGRIREYALRRSILDVPTHRSSHTLPTPRGGGLAIAIVVLTVVAVQAIFGGHDARFAVGMVGAGGFIAGIGWVDDHGDVSAGVRILVQFLAAGWIVYWLGAPVVFRLGQWVLPLGIAGPVLTTVGLVWLTNLFNFMDGIDGIAATETIWVGAVAGCLLIAAGLVDLGTTALVLSSASIGFLVWNKPPARIFMGDAGSGFLGLALGGIAVAGDKAGGVPLMVWVLLLGVFLFDATVTLFRRIGRERLYVAHRRHAYQRAVQAGWSHLRVTTTVLYLNVLLSALGVLVWAYPRAGSFALPVGLVLLLAAYLAVEHARPMWNAGGFPPDGQ